MGGLIVYFLDNYLKIVYILINFPRSDGDVSTVQFNSWQFFYIFPALTGP